jgi:hypothetical protein
MTARFTYRFFTISSRSSLGMTFPFYLGRTPAWAGISGWGGGGSLLRPPKSHPSLMPCPKRVTIHGRI